MTKEIADFGQKLEGACKHTYTARILNMTAPESGFKTSDLFPTLDPLKLKKEGLSNLKIAVLLTLRETVATKPRQSWKVTQWEKKTLATFESFKEALKLDDKYLRDAFGHWPAVRLRVYLKAENMKKAAGWTFRRGTYTMFDGEEFPAPRTLHTAIKQSRRAPIKPARTEKKCVRALAAWLKVSKVAPKAKSSQFRIYRSRETREYYFARKIRRNVISVKGGFDTLQAARDWYDEEFLETKWQEMKTPPRLRNINNEPRTGPSLNITTKEENVSPNEFAGHFGFRGVQFGNYVEQTKRQADLNDAFDGLQDLAAVLECSTLILSLGGELGLAFGARGRGGANPASAHYEPGHHVINLTKASGAGSLAHEWFHALDFMWGEGKSFATEKEGRGAAKRFFQLGQKLQVVGTYKARSLEFDKFRSKPYFSTTLELAARAFEVWIKDNLAKMGIRNDYLANVNDGDAYPTAAEMAELAPIFREITKCLK